MDQRRSIAERNALAEQWLDLIWWTVRRFVALHPDALGRLEMGDLAAEGALALVRCAERFDPARGVKFNTVAVVYIHQALSRACNTADVILVPPWLSNAERAAHQPRYEHFDDVAASLLGRTDDVPTDEQAADLRRLDAALDQLDPADAHAFRRAVGDGAKPYRIARELHNGVKRVRQRIERATHQLRAVLRPGEITT